MVLLVHTGSQKTEKSLKVKIDKKTELQQKVRLNGYGAHQFDFVSTGDGAAARTTSSSGFQNR